MKFMSRYDIVKDTEIIPFGSELIRKIKKQLNNKNFPSEVRFQSLLNTQFVYLKYKRNEPILGRFFVDFYLPHYGLCIEIDGGIHKKEKEIKYDEIRDFHIKKAGYGLLRLSTDLNNAQWITRFEEFLDSYGVFRTKNRCQKRKKKSLIKRLREEAKKTKKKKLRKGIYKLMKKRSEYKKETYKEYLLRTQKNTLPFI
jgi:very-short-patch-repair endonuclease